MNQLIDTFLDHLAVERGLAENTRLAYRLDLTQFADHLRGQNITRPHAVQRDHITRYLLAQRQRGLSARSLSRHLAAIRMFFRYLAREKLVPGDPTQTVDSPRLWKLLPHTLDYREVERLLEAPDVRSPVGLRDRALLELMYATGLRVSEAAHLPLGAVDFDAGFLRVVGKGNKERIVPVGTQARDWLRRYLTDGRPALVGGRPARPEVFLSRRGAALSRKTIWESVRKYARGAGITRHLSPHTLRHSFATHLLNNGGDLRVIQEMLGHADIGTTQVYTQVDQQRLKDIHSRFHPRSGRRRG